jgi:hypothetical protein
VPGTYFTKEQLEVDLEGNGYYYFLQSHFNQANEFVYKVDNVSGGILTGGWRMKYIGNVYSNDKEQYDKALA